MRTLLRVPLKPLEQHNTLVSKGLIGGPSLGPHYACRTSDVSFSSLVTRELSRHLIYFHQIVYIYIHTYIYIYACWQSRQHLEGGGGVYASKSIVFKMEGGMTKAPATKAPGIYLFFSFFF